VTRKERVGMSGRKKVRAREIQTPEREGINPPNSRGAER